MSQAEDMFRDRAAAEDPAAAGEYDSAESAGTSGQLVRAAAAGSSAAWELLVARYTGLMWAVARSFRLGDASSADAVQTAWLRLAEHLDTLREPDRVGVWLATTVRRECLRLLRGRTRECPTQSLHETEPADVRPGPEARAMSADRDARVRVALGRLPERDQRLLAVLMASPPPSYTEVAAALDMPVGSIGPTRARCLARLRRELAEVGIEDGS